MVLGKIDMCVCTVFNCMSSRCCILSELLEMFLVLLLPFVVAFLSVQLPEAPLPEDYVDPNFINRKQQKMDVMFHKHFPN